MDTQLINMSLVAVVNMYHELVIVLKWYHYFVRTCNCEIIFLFFFGRWVDYAS